MRLFSIPSPEQGVWHLGFFPIRAYAFCILIGIVVAIWLGERRWQARGGQPGLITDLSVWMVPFGVIGGRIYHVVTTWSAYFGPHGDPAKALRIWEGGLGIWGAVVLGGVGGWIGARRRKVPLPMVADAIAPGIVLAQGIGRLGNWFNNELYGSATTLPWGLQVHEWDQSAGRALVDAQGHARLLEGLYHPTFLYELLWDVGVCLVLLWIDRRRQIGHGRLFALYVALYTAGRFWIEMLRTDPATEVLGLRLNVWTSIVVFLGAVTYIVISARQRPGRESMVERASTS
ncbi:MAG: prolipoprotein diacylglyceryl transferase [Kineosporiaceae bacterium]